MADDTEEERVKMKSLKLDEPVQGEPNMYTNQPKANSDGHLVEKKTKGDDTFLEKNLHSSPVVMFDLFEAVWDGDTEKVVHLLQRGVDPNQIPSDCFMRIIHDSRMLKVLIEGGLELNQDTIDLAKAVLNRDEKKVVELLKSDADLSQILDFVVDNGDIRMLKVMLAGGLELNQFPDNVLIRILRSSDKRMIEVLKEGRSELKQLPDNVLLEILRTSDERIIQSLKECGYELKQIPDNFINKCVYNRELQILKVFLEEGVDLKRIPDDFIQELVEKREIGILKVLIEGGLKLKQIPDDCIQELVENREIGILKVLIEGGLKLKQIPDIFIHELVHNGEIGMIKVLLEGGLKLKKIPDLFITKVVYKRHDEMLKIFVEGGWDVNRIPDRCIHELVYQRNIGMLKVLLEGGLEQERISEDDIDDLVNTSDIEILKALLKGGLEVKRIPDPVIDRLVHTDDVEMLNVLVERGLVLKRDTRTDEDSERHPDGNITTKRMDGAKQVATVVQENDMEAFMSLKDTFVAAYPLGESSWHLLHIVAVYGTAEMVDCIQRWTRIDWDRQHTIHEDIFEKTSGYTKVKEATALYLASCLDRTDIVRSLVKLAGEDNIRSCLQGITLSIELEHVFMLQLADRLRQKHAELKPTIVPGYRHEDNGTQSRVFIVYSVYVVHGNDYDFNGLGLVKLRNPYIMKRTNCGALASETGVETEDAETEPDADKELSNAHVEKSPNDDANSSEEGVEGLSNEDAKRVTEAIQAHRDCLWQSHSNLNIITGRRVKRNLNGFNIHEACVVMYCSTKGVIPLGENVFPRTLSIKNGDYVNVVIREGFFDFGGYATASGTSHHSYLKMGCDIGRSTPQFDTRGRSILNSGGTLGPFVRFNNDLGFLTCAHVLFDIPSHSNYIDFTAAFPMVQVAQPSMNSTASGNATECGVVERAVFDPSRTVSIDATVVKITDQSRKPAAGRFSNERPSTYVDAGFKELPEYNNGSMLSRNQLNGLPSKPNVVKFGSRTDVTKGALGVVGADVRAYSKALGFGDSAGKIRMENQYLVTGIHPSTDFFDGGDSGSAVFCQDNNGQLVCVGMAIGHCILNDYPYKAGIVTPIDAILQTLGPNFKLATFP